MPREPPETMKYLGVLWTRSPNSLQYVGYLEGERFKMMTWPFGDRHHQARVDVLYPGTRSHFAQDHLDSRIRVCFDGPACTRRDAFRKMVKWVRRYQQKGSQTPRQVWLQAFSWYGDIYKTRLGFLRDLVEGGGNGYEWLDGHFGDHTQEQWPGVRRRKAEDRRHNARCDNIDRLIRKLDDLFVEIGEEPPPPAAPSRNRECTAPAPDDDDAPFADRVSEHAAFTEVPDDAHPTWVALSYEAARLILGRPHPDAARSVAQRVVVDLSARFPWVAEPAAPGSCPMTHRRHSRGPKSWGYECIYCGAPLPRAP